MNLDQIRKLCQEIVDRYDLQSNSDYHEGRKDDEVQIYLTLKFKAKLASTKKILDKM